MAEEEEQDIISTLPDTILCHILSFLQTKHAVATSVLSTRWKHLYLSVPVLYFEAMVTDQNKYILFNDFVYSVLLSRDPALPINTFYLNYACYNRQLLNPHYSVINTVIKWIKFVAQRSVQYLDLCVELEADEFPKLPLTVLNFKTLVVLKLHSFRLKETFSPVDLPSLKTLELDVILFNKVRDLILFLTGCPILENLYANDVVFDSEESLTCNEWKSFCLTNLTRANIDCFSSNFPLKAVHNVPSLRLQIDQVNCGDDFIPTFHNLTQLDLYLPNYSWHFILEVLKQCPKLQKLNIDQLCEDRLNKEMSDREDDRENWVDPDFVPQCLLLHLRTCNLIHFLGRQGELLLARYILKNARVLQAMRIKNVGKTKIERLISSYPMASTTCKVTVYGRSNKTWRK